MLSTIHLYITLHQRESDVDVVSMAFVINVNMAPADSRDYALSEIYYSVLELRDVRNTMWLVNTPCEHETLTQCRSNFGPISATLTQHQTSTGSTSHV